MSADNFKETNIPKSINRRKAILNILFYVIIAGAVFAVFALTHREPTLTGLPYATEFLIGLAVFLFSIGASIYTWRCPKCNKFLGFRLGISKCNNCKAELKEPDIDGADAHDDYFRYIQIFQSGYLKCWLYIILVLVLNIGLLVLVTKVPAADSLGYLFPFTIFIPFFYLRHKYLRCPKCGYHFGRHIPPECPECKVRIKDYDSGEWR
jgi:hypothetical protein